MAAPAEAPGMPLKQKMATGFKALLGGARRLALGDDGGSDRPPAKMDELFVRTDPAVDGDGCLHDCDGCSAQFPRGFKIDEADLLYGYVRGWSTHVLVATGKSDWVRDVTHEKGSVMQAIGNAHSPSNGVSSKREDLLFSQLVTIHTHTHRERERERRERRERERERANPYTTETHALGLQHAHS